MAPRTSFTTEFLLRELLAALGVRAPAEAAPADSFSESLSEDTESQAAASAPSQSRVMLVRRTNSSRHTATLVDRAFDVEAFVPAHVGEALLQQQGFQTLGRLRGSVVRVTKYHFATLARCLAEDALHSSSSSRNNNNNNNASVSAPNVGRGGARVYLCVDALAVVEENELAVKPQPDVYSHPAVAERLQALSDAELEKQLMIHQGLPPLRTAGDRFDDDRPLREEDCVIPEDQEQQLEEQDDWGLPTTTGPQPTDSELIEENGHVPMPESQVVQGNAQSTQDSLASSGDLSVVLSAHSSTSSVTLPGNPSVTLSGEVSVDSTLDSPKFHFQQENIRETFVVGSDLESDTEDEDNGEQEAKDAKASTLKSQRRASSSTPVRSSPAPTTPKPSQSSCMIVDLTDDSPGKAPPAVLTSATKAMQAVEPKTDAEASQQAASDSAADRASSQTPQKSHQTPETPSRQTGWGTIFRKLASNLVGLGTPSAEDSHPDAHRSDEEFNESAEDDQQATQLLNQPESEKEVTESKEDEPEEFISSQATVVLEYAIDNDEDANAFEYEGMISDDMASPRSTASRRNDRITSEVHSPAADASNSVDDDLTLTEDYVDVTVTPQKQSPPKDATPDLKTPSSSKQTVKPGTEMRTNTRQALSVTSHSPAHSNDSSRGGNPLTSTNPVPRTDESAKLSPAKSPSNLVISVGSNLSQAKRSEPSTTGPRASKRKREHTSPEDPSPETTNADLVQENAVIVSPPQPQSDAQQREQAQKRRRREILPSFEGGSQSPQFEQPSSPFVSRRKTQSDRTTIIADSYSLDAVCRSLGSHVRDQANEEDQARSARQPRRAWKRYERLFPPLNMTRLKQMMAEDKSK